jgi:hypothetical protein
MSDETRNIFDAAQRMSFFADANTQLIHSLPVAVELFDEVKTAVAALEQAGIAKSSADGTGRSATRTKAAIYNALYEGLREMSGTALIIKKRVPEFENKFPLQRDKLTYQQAIERGRAFFDDSAPQNVQQIFTGYGLKTDFREELIENVNALAGSTHTQADAKLTSVGETAQINALLEDFMDVRETLKRVMKNLLKDNPQKLAEWLTASRIERRKRKSEPPPENNSPAA